MCLVVGIVLGVLAQVVNIGILEILCLGYAQDFLALGLVEELALFVKQLQRIPHAGVVAGRQDDAAVGALHGDGNLGGGGAGQADVHHIKAHAHERAADHILHHLAGDACVAAHHYLV